ncbi:MAG: HGGxSTG domain-containing protein [Rhodospirillales bacterium]|nr:HGGxSTG domain-containing protein [Rhodospirillales bacterium]
MAGRASKWDKRCGAKTRQGRPCLRRPVKAKQRCPNHGGLSTGLRPRSR